MARMTTDLEQDYAGDVTLHDDSDRDGEVLRGCRLFTLGDVVALNHWSPVTKRFERVDRIFEVDVQELSGGRLEFTGVSERLTDPDGNAVPAESAKVRWVLEPKGCPTCR